MPIQGCSTLNLYIRTSPAKSVRVMYAWGIVALFPYLQDPYSQNGYVSKGDFATLITQLLSEILITLSIWMYLITQEHYYDPESSSGSHYIVVKDHSKKFLKLVGQAMVDPNHSEWYDLPLLVIQVILLIECIFGIICCLFACWLRQ